MALTLILTLFERFPGDSGKLPLDTVQEILSGIQNEEAKSLAEKILQMKSELRQKISRAMLDSPDVCFNLSGRDKDTILEEEGGKLVRG
jgi:hypothetical protein